MRIEYNFDLSKVDVPAFSVEAGEGVDKLFKLATVVMNVLGDVGRVDVVFHSPNQGDVPRTVDTFRRVLGGAPHCPQLEFVDGEAGALGSSYFRWITVERKT